MSVPSLIRPRLARTRVKICGITTPEAARVAIDAGADAIGLVFARNSPRSIDTETARRIVHVLPPMVTAVSVFATGDGPLDDGLDADAPAWCQVHGDVDEETLERIAARRRVARGFRFDPEAVRRWHACESVSALLVDGSAGGAGTAFDHDALAAIMPELRKPVILAGGLTPDNVGAAIAAVRPYAVDVSSGVESAPGVKDESLVRAFCAAVRGA